MIKSKNKPDIIIWTYEPKDIVVKNFNAFAYCKLNPQTGLVDEIKEKSFLIT